MVLNVPGTQPSQVRSAVTVPGTATYSPATQFSIAVHSGALSDVEKVSEGHAAQIRFASAVPTLTSNSPAIQSVWVTHSVAGSESWSHFPVGQVAFTVVPPGHQVPTSHEAQTTGLVGVPEAATSVPASH
jgi:hypothetical protein